MLDFGVNKNEKPEATKYILACFVGVGIMVFCGVVFYLLGFISSFSGFLAALGGYAVGKKLEVKDYKKFALCLAIVIIISSIAVNFLTLYIAVTDVIIDTGLDISAGELMSIYLEEDSFIFIKDVLLSVLFTVLGVTVLLKKDTK